MSIHASKGLEFDHVFIIGLEEGILPFTIFDENYNTCNNNTANSLLPRIEEEKRLLYVAMTRAKTGLYLSWAHSRVFKGRKLTCSPSPFLGELENTIPFVKAKLPKTDGQLRLF